MNKIFAPFLPPWVETGLQPAFYDMESGTVLQQTARMYAKVQQLTRLFNEFSEDVSNEVNNFEHDVNNEINNFEHDVNETVQEYIDKFVELKNFVDDYFDNLDVQEEINNKLDAMVQDGTLQTIIEAYLQPNVAWTFDSISEMKSATNLIDDTYAQTYGFYAVGDGGGARYKIRKAEENETADNIFTFEVNDGLIAELVKSNNKKFNVLQLGIKRNVNASQNTKLASIIAKMTNGDTLYFPSGEYNFDSKITLLHRMNIEGDPLSTGERDPVFNGSRFKFSISESPANDYILIDCTSNNKTLIKNIHVISDSYEMSCDRSQQSTNSTAVDTFTTTINTPNIIGIKLTNYGSEIDNVIIQGCSKYGIDCGRYNLINNVRVYSSSTAFYIENDNTMNDCNCFTANVGISINGDINLINNFRADEVKRGIWCYSDGNNINNFTIDYALYNAVQLEGADNNFVSGTIGRVGTYYAEKGANEALRSCYVGIIGCKYNNININGSKRNTRDSGEAVYNPCHTIVSKGTNQGNDITITGEPKFLSFKSTKLTTEELKSLITIADGYCSDILHYYAYTYVFNSTTSSYANNTISVTTEPNFYSAPAIYNKTINTLSGTTASFALGSSSNYAILLIVSKSGTSDRGVYLLGYSTATLTLEVTPIVALTGASVTNTGTTINISGLTEYSTVSILSNQPL